MNCEICKDEVSEAVANFSNKKYGQTFCYSCQQQQAPKQPDKPKGNAHTINLNGKEYVTHAGLLDAAHKKGLLDISTQMIEKTDDLVVFQATVIIKDEKEGQKKFSAFGDASKESLAPQMVPHRIRMAETRALNRALRFATNIGMCSIEELGEK